MRRKPYNIEDRRRSSGRRKCRTPSQPPVLPKTWWPPPEDPASEPREAVEMGVKTSHLRGVSPLTGRHPSARRSAQAPTDPSRNNSRAPVSRSTDFLDSNAPGPINPTTYNADVYCSLLLYRCSRAAYYLIGFSSLLFYRRALSVCYINTYCFLCFLLLHSSVTSSG